MKNRGHLLAVDPMQITTLAMFRLLHHLHGNLEVFSASYSILLKTGSAIKLKMSKAVSKLL